MNTLRGLTMMVVTADDIEVATEWYADYLGQAPYFRKPSGGRPRMSNSGSDLTKDELGIMDRAYSPEGQSQGAVRSFIGTSRMLKLLSPIWWAVERQCTCHSLRVDRSSSLPRSTRSATCSASDAVRAGPAGTGKSGTESRRRT